MNPIVFGITFATSFIIYAWLRRFDVASTKAFAKYVDMNKHEVNPLINWLLRRGYSLNQSFTITLFLFGVPIALGDAVLNSELLFGIPVLAFTCGCFHIIAAASNFGYLPKLREMSAEEIRAQEADMFAFSVRFGGAGLRGKLRLLWDRQGFDVAMSALFLLAFSALYYAVGVTGLGSVELLFLKHGYPVYSYFNMGWILAFTLLAFYPVRVMATLTMARRYQKLSGSGGMVQPPTGPTGGDGGMILTVDELRSILKMAEDNNTDRVKLFLGPAGVNATA